MRINLLTASFFPSIGGVEVGLHNLAVRYVKNGHSVYIVCPFSALSFLIKSRNLPYTIIPLPPRFFSLACRLENPLVRIFYFLTYYFVQVISRPDFWHISMSYPAGLSFLPFSRIFPVSYAVRSVGADIQVDSRFGYGYRLNSAVDSLFKRYFSHLLYHVAASNCLIDMYRSLGVPCEKITKIPNGVDVKRINPTLTSKNIADVNVIRLLSVGRNDPKKSYATLLDSFRRLCDELPEKFSLSIYGSNVLKLSKNLPPSLSSKIFLVEPINTRSNSTQFPSSDIINAYASSHIFVFPSLLESFGIVILEAMAAGLPVIAFDVPGVNELVEDGVTGYLIKPNDFVAFSDAVAKASNPDIYRSISKNCLEFARSFDWDIVSKKYLNFYASIIHE